MSEPKRRTSGEHEAVIGFRRKLESISEHTMPQLTDLNARLDRLKKKSDPPKRDPRREVDDARQDDAVPVDVVELEPDPFPSVQPPKE